MIKKLLPEVQAFVEGLELSAIPAERQEILSKLGSYLHDKVAKGESVNLNFICTHNSRRSQLSQVWAQTAAYHFGLENVQAFSGGTEATAFHFNAVQTLKNSGFDITKKEPKNNPVYAIKYAPEVEPLACFSKVYHDPLNTAPFIAVMTCSDADQNCPLISEAEARFAVRYEDPKVADGTDQQEQLYAERNKQIALEMVYLFSLLSK